MALNPSNGSCLEQLGLKPQERESNINRRHLTLHIWSTPMPFSVLTQNSTATHEQGEW